ncbi:MAG: DUF3601 domain-containing protein [Flammeovirgaceae bacterium]|nr:DUF3601 domain-containing protein [Flammeovirgaceae bacterium]
MITHISNLTEGQKIKVIKGFKDFDRKEIKAGSIWTFRSYSYFIYDGGYTVSFNEGVMRLAEIDHETDNVLSNFNESF